ncbi:DNA repair exonuclease rad1 [Fusarium longipes]|uniref:DNA repair exonuclease rad1 n=1 Tax=Fusarium longipes TaxID=694270 RepID=A0A395T6E4_9HYPO|nr:DNA repair exonuclease rad1 [Fusarium longipes]
MCIGHDAPSLPAILPRNPLNSLLKNSNNCNPSYHNSNPFTTKPMDSSLHEVWQAAAGSPFFPTVHKDTQFTVAFALLLVGFFLTGVFALNRTLINVPLLGIPASLALAWSNQKKTLLGAPIAFLPVFEPFIHAPFPVNHIHNFDMSTDAQPIFRAVATSTRPLYQLLRCINFAPRVHVQITEEGVRFASDHARVMQGVAFLDKSLFSSYTVNLPAQDGDDAPELPNFQLSLSSVLEVLQIFGAVDVATRAHKAEQDPYRSNLRNYRPDAFSNQTLGISGTCTLLYAQEGDQFKITIEESGVKTTASLITYLPEIPDDIPFDRTDLTFKIIMQSRTLLDSLAEISPTAPMKLTITATKASPFLSLAGAGDLGSSGVDFARGRDLLETFTIQDRWSQAYKFDFIKNSTEAMRIANKVSLRGDSQGVLSLQFMVDIEGGKRSFLDFRFVPFIQHDGEDDDEADGADEAD